MKNIIKVQYHSKLLSKLGESENWPTFDRPDFLEELDNFADNAFGKGTLEGYLAALLIYHQLCEEMARLLINCSVFQLQLEVFPEEINSINSKRLKNKMFGQLMQELEQGVMNNNIRRFISKCNELNPLRVRMVHRITLKTSINDVSRQCKQAKKIFNDIYQIFDIVYDAYRVKYSGYKKAIEELRETAAEYGMNSKLSKGRSLGNVR